MSTNDSPEDAEIKASFLVALNEFRAAIGKPRLKTFPSECCWFCGKPKEEAGLLYSGVIDFIHICRDCAVVAQRAFMRSASEKKEGGI